jgi:hypothetical protein
VSKARRRKPSQTAATERTPILNSDGRIVSWKPSAEETAQRERELAATLPAPQDYVSAEAYLSDCLYDDELAALDEDALLAHYRTQRPDAILDERGACWQAWRGDMTRARS